MRLSLLGLIVFGLIGLVAPRAEAGRGTALVKYLPDDAQAIAVADVAKARRSPVFKKGYDVARSKHDFLDSLSTNVAVEKLVDTIVAGGSKGANGDHMVAVFEGKIDKLLVEIKKTSTKEEKHNGITYWVIPEGEVALLDKRLVFATAGDMKSVIERAADKKAKGPAAMRTILANASSTAAVFGGAVLDAQSKKDLAKEFGAEPQWAAFSFGMAQKLTLDGRLKFADDATAEKAAKQINDKLGAPGAEGTVRSQAEGWIGKDFSDSITVDNDHSFTRLSATLTGEEVDKVLTLVKMFM